VELRNKNISNGVFISRLPVRTFTEIVIEFAAMLILAVNRPLPGVKKGVVGMHVSATPPTSSHHSYYLTLELIHLSARTGNILIEKAEDKLKEANEYVEKCENAPQDSVEYCDLANAKLNATMAKKQFDELWDSYGGYR
jgi:hypothetical protein